MLGSVAVSPLVAFALTYRKFPISLIFLLAGKLDAETGSTTTASATTPNISNWPSTESAFAS
jgi:hypothetical protein